MEFYVQNDGLINEEEWLTAIEKLKAETSELKQIDNQEEAVTLLKEQIVQAVKKRMPSEPFGIFFSGGVDSTLIALICKQLGGKFRCYNVGFQTPEMAVPTDVGYALGISQKVELDVKSVVFGLEDAERLIEKTVRLLPKPSKIDIDYIVKVGVGTVVVAAHKISEGEQVFFSGLGSEEIYAGYDRHSHAEDVNEECWNGLKMMRNRDLLRDHPLALALGIDIATPLLDPTVVVSSMRVVPELKINPEKKKIILRHVAEELGLPKEYAWRKKQGAQYGSKLMKLLDKVAKKNGFKTKKEYLEKLTEL